MSSRGRIMSHKFPHPARTRRSVSRTVAPVSPRLSGVGRGSWWIGTSVSLAVVLIGLIGWSGFEALQPPQIGLPQGVSRARLSEDGAPTEAEMAHFLALAGVSIPQVTTKGASSEAASAQERRARDYVAANIGLLRKCEETITGRSFTFVPPVAFGGRRNDNANSDRDRAMRTRAALFEGVRHAALGDAQIPSPAVSQPLVQMPVHSSGPSDGEEIDPIASAGFAARGIGLRSPREPQ